MFKKKIMQKIITHIDQNGRMLIPIAIREKLNIHPGEKIALEINDNIMKIISVDNTIDEMNKLFMKNRTKKVVSIVDDFIEKKHQEFLIEENRYKK